jgi:hypothetical protein
MYRDIEPREYSGREHIMRQGHSFGQLVFVIIKGQAVLVSESPGHENYRIVSSTVEKHCDLKYQVIGLCEMEDVQGLDTGYNVSALAGLYLFTHSMLMVRLYVCYFCPHNSAVLHPHEQS